MHQLNESVVLKMYFDGAWETLEDGRIEYDNGKITAFCFQKDVTFEQFIAKLYGILKKSPKSCLLLGLVKQYIGIGEIG